MTIPGDIWPFLVLDFSNHLFPKNKSKTKTDPFIVSPIFTLDDVIRGRHFVVHVIILFLG